MDKKTLLKKILNAGSINGRNSMGANESFYNEYFSVKTCFSEEELMEMSEKELKNLLRLAEFLAGVFY